MIAAGNAILVVTSAFLFVAGGVSLWHLARFCAPRAIECEFCHSKQDLGVMLNGGFVCGECRAALRGE